MDAAALIARLEEQRRQWVELAPGGPRVRFMRPLETDFGRFRLGVTVDHVCEYVDGWAGMTEAVVLGPSNGSAEVAVPFTPALWAALVRDRMEWVPPVARALAESISQHLKTKEAAAGN